MDKEELYEQRKNRVEELIYDKNYKPMNEKELMDIMQVPKEDKAEFMNIINELMAECKITLNGKKKFKKAGTNIVCGTFMATTRGFGFVKVEGMKNDIFISASDVNDAFAGDTVQVRIDDNSTINSFTHESKNPEGVIVYVIKRNVTQIVGMYQASRDFGFVVPDDKKIKSDIYIPKKKSKGAVNGHKVVVEITSYGDDNSNPEGVITEIIGHANDPGVDVMSVVRACGIPYEFPDEVMEEVESIPEVVLEEEKTGREDIRNLPTVTIDGEDAKDLDDAITISRDGEFYILGVHIADVTHYVKENSPLDKEALKRGTSVYLADRVIPQLPHALSNGICSLNAGTDRLALSCFMKIDKKGVVVDHRISETLINVDRRMTYTDVNKIVEFDDPDTCKKYEDFVGMFKLMQELALILRTKRKKRGSIDFDFPETKISLDEKGKIVDIQPYERNKATRIIEDFMLIANETIAEDFFWKETPFVYRTHENPDSEKILKLSIFINNFGYAIKGDKEEIHPKELQKLIEKIEGTPEEMLISRLTLRSMKQAKYSTDCEGHFGLATKYYCHFTSPIRRYPDLQIHRIIKESLNGKLTERRVRHYEKILPEVARLSSCYERRADDAEREVEKIKKVVYMKQFIGQEFDGVISGVNSFGFFVELPNTVEGMVRIDNIDWDQYEFVEEKYMLMGTVSHRQFTLGQKISVKLLEADVALRQITFGLGSKEFLKKGSEEDNE
ncbi:MAG: ribonuclease R [Lachnospiraceae bacterium]|nr:ribonuclease R [Lachnospiraceae bacterium]